MQARQPAGVADPLARIEALGDDLAARSACSATRIVSSPRKNDPKTSWTPRPSSVNASAVAYSWPSVAEAVERPGDDDPREPSDRDEEQEPAAPRRARA